MASRRARRVRVPRREGGHEQEAASRAGASPAPAALRAYEDTCLLTVFSSKLIAEANCRCLYDGERGPLIDPGPWMFLVRLGEGTPALDPDADGLLWTSVAGIEARWHDVRREPGTLCAPSAVAIPHPGSSTVHETNAAALEAIAAFKGTGIAVCIDPWSESNDGILRALTARLELRPPDDTRKVIWYCRPPRPLFAPGANEAAQDQAEGGS